MARTWFWCNPSCFTVSFFFSGMIDSSGLRFYYTKQLRKYDAGVLFVGAFVDYRLTIPPKETNWQINGFCSEECTRKVCRLKYSSQFKASSPMSLEVLCFFSFLVTMTSRGLSRSPKQNKSVERRSFRFRKHNIVLMRSTWSNFAKVRARGCDYYSLVW